MNDDDKKDIGIFGFRRLRGRARRRALPVVFLALFVILAAVWFVVIRH